MKNSNNSKIIIAIIAIALIGVVLFTQTSIFDPLGSKCDSSFNDAKYVFEKKFNATVELNERKKFENTNEATTFYKKWSLIPNPLDLIRLDKATYPIVLYAINVQSKAGTLPYVTICENGAITNNPTQ